MDIVSIIFQNKNNPNDFTGREYSYYTAIPLKEGDVVIVPTKNGSGIGKVTRVGIKESELNFNPALLRTIESLAGNQAKQEQEAETMPALTF